MKLTKKQQEIIDSMVNQFEKMNASSVGLIDWKNINNEVEEWNRFKHEIEISNSSMLELIKEEVKNTSLKIQNELDNIFLLDVYSVDLTNCWRLKKSRQSIYEIRIHLISEQKKHISDCGSFNVNEIIGFKYIGFVNSYPKEIKIIDSNTIENVFKQNVVLNKIKECIVK